MNNIKDIFGYEGIYAITENGKLFSYPRNNKNQYKNGGWPKGSIDKYGYHIFNLKLNGTKNYPRAHRLVALTYIPNPENKPTVNHKDGNKRNNHVSNLEWATQSEQQIHSVKIGLRTSIKGIDYKSCKKIINLTTGKIYFSLTEAARLNNVLITSLSNCLRKNDGTCGGFKWKYYYE